MLPALVQCNRHLLLLPYFKLPFDLRSSQLLLHTYRQPFTSWALPIRHKGMLHWPVLIKVSVGADSSSLKLAGLHGLKHSLSPTACLNHTLIHKYRYRASFTFSKCGNKLLMVKSLTTIWKFTYFSSVFYSFFL